MRSEHCNRLFQDKKKSKSIRLQLLAKKQILRKMYLALLVEILVFLTFLPGLFVVRKNSRSGRSSCESRCSPLLLVF